MKLRSDRYKSAVQEFKKLNINNVEFYFADKSPKGGRYGCFESHINVIQQCYNEGCNNILIFEDDIRPSYYYDIKLLKNAIDFMINNKWDIFYIGYFITKENIIADNIFISNKLYNNNILQYNPWSTHAYCLNRNTMYKILTTYNKFIDTYHIDNFYSNQALFTNYCIIPSLFEQYFCYTIDNEIETFGDIIGRKTQCIMGDYINIHSNSSYICYIYNKYYYLINILCILILYLYIYELRFF